ncbi:MAG: acyltransferase [Eubacteriales bacterium]
MIRFFYQLYLMSRSSFFSFIARRLIRSVGKGTIFEGQFEVPLFYRVSIGNTCHISRGVSFIVTETGRIELGDRVYLGRDCVLASETGIFIGDNTMLAEFVSVIDADHGTTRKDIPMRDQALVPRPVNIGPDVWIGRSCAVLKGVTIGEGAVIGANSVVTGDIPPYAVACGCPARVIRFR